MIDFPGKRRRSSSEKTSGRSTMPWIKSEYCFGSIAGTPP
jgi:hypothetical protein